MHAKTRGAKTKAYCVCNGSSATTSGWSWRGWRSKHEKLREETARWPSCSWSPVVIVHPPLEHREFGFQLFASLLLHLVFRRLWGTQPERSWNIDWRRLLNYNVCKFLPYKCLENQVARARFNSKTIREGSWVRRFEVTRFSYWRFTLPQTRRK